MGGASAAASSRLRKSAASRKNQRTQPGGNDFDSLNQSDDRLLGTSMPSINGKLRDSEGVNSSFRSFRSRRRDENPQQKCDDGDHNLSLGSSKGIELHQLQEEIEIIDAQDKGKGGFNESDNVSASNTPSQLPSWFNTLNNCRKYIGERVNDDRVQNFILLLIIINSIMMGIATFPFVKNNPDLSYQFDLADQIFLIIFSVESCLQLLYFGWYLFKDSFLVFDLLTVIMSWALEGTQVIRAFRIFRAFRLIPKIQVMRNLVLALFSVMPKMSAISLLLMLIFFIFGVMMTTLFKGMYPETLTQPYFESLWLSLFTLFQMMTLVSAVFRK